MHVGFNWQRRNIIERGVSMTIASEITRIKTNINNAYTALEAKGATIPSEKNSANLASTVNTITGGGSSGETNYLGRIVTEDGVLQFPEENFSFSLPDNVTSIGENGLHSTFYRCTSLTSVDLSNATSIGDSGLSSAFQGCTSLTSVDLSNATSIGANGLYYAFQGCTSLTSVDLSNATSISNNGLNSAFRDCTSLTSVDLSNATSINAGGLGDAFQDCTSLTSVNLSNVTSIGILGLQSAFRGCTSLTSLSFPKLNSKSFGRYTNQFLDMLYGVTGCTVHFPFNLESVIGSWSDVTSGFGGTNTTVLFDLGGLPCTITVTPELNTEIYINNELKNSSDFPQTVVPERDTFCIYNPDYPIYGGAFTADESASEITLNVDLTTLTKRTLTINSNEENCTCTFNIGGKEFTPKTSTATTYSIDVADGTEVTYTCSKDGYNTITNTVTVTGTDQSIDVTLIEYIEHSISYPFTDSSYFNLTNLVKGDNFIINDTLQAITSGDSSYNKNSGTSYGYIEFVPPTGVTVLEVSCYVSSERNYDYGAVYLGSQPYQPTQSQIKNGTTDGNGSYLYNKSGEQTEETVTAALTPGQTYYLSFAYAKDSSSEGGEDRLIITNIKIHNEV